LEVDEWKVAVHITWSYYDLSECGAGIDLCLQPYRELTFLTICLL